MQGDFWDRESPWHINANGRIVEQWRSGWEVIVSRFLKIWNLRNTGITWFKKGFLIMTIWMSLKPRKQGKPELNFFYERCYFREHEKLIYLWCLWAFISHICTSYFRETYQKPYKDDKVIISSLATVLKSFSWRVHVLKCLLRFSWNYTYCICSLIFSKTFNKRSLKSFELKDITFHFYFNSKV